MERIAPSLDRNYLRVRGEYFPPGCLPCARWELPPRARRIQGFALPSAIRKGTTSACAENTGAPLGLPTCVRNYLRVRGEYHTAMMQAKDAAELPPRARRIRSLISSTRWATGTTSACAENTYMKKSMIRRMWNYLRVRGEYKNTGWLPRPNSELPPRARRIPFHFSCTVLYHGTTSACAENTPLMEKIKI